MVQCFYFSLFRLIRARLLFDLDEMSAGPGATIPLTSLPSSSGRLPLSYARQLIIWGGVGDPRCSTGLIGKWVGGQNRYSPRSATSVRPTTNGLGGFASGLSSCAFNWQPSRSDSRAYLVRQPEGEPKHSRGLKAVAMRSCACIFVLGCAFAAVYDKKILAPECSCLSVTKISLPEAPAR